MVFVDSNFWIGFLNTNDRHSKRAVELFPKLQMAPEKIYITSGILHEVVNHLFKVRGKKVALEALNLFLSTPNLEILFITDSLWKDEIKIFVEDELSLTDAQIVAAMHEKNDGVLFSFDAHFDQVKLIRRVY